MRAVVQRVSRARVSVEGNVTGSIGTGIVALVGVGADDEPSDAEWLARKVHGLRIFPGEDGVNDRSVAEVGGEVLAVSQFTIMGDARRGRRPSYIQAAPPERAEPLYRAFCEHLAALGVPVAEGVFQAMMDLELVNDGPVTILLDSKRGF